MPTKDVCGSGVCSVPDGVLVGECEGAEDRVGVGDGAWASIRATNERLAHLTVEQRSDRLLKEVEEVLRQING